MFVSVYLAASLDGFIADESGGLGWLTSIPNPSASDYGYADFMKRVDVVVMGRHTFDTVFNFSEWPYERPVFVLSHRSAPDTNRYRFLQGTPDEILNILSEMRLERIYLDGGQVIQQFLTADRVDELILTRIPVLLGKGIPLFSSLPSPLAFDFIRSEEYSPQVQKNYYLRRRT